jgi:hypothetical protein
MGMFLLTTGVLLKLKKVKTAITLPETKDKTRLVLRDLRSMVDPVVTDTD